MWNVGMVNAGCCCGSKGFERLVVDQPDGTLYVTALMSCPRCKVTFYPPAVARLGATSASQGTEHCVAEPTPHYDARSAPLDIARS